MADLDGDGPITQIGATHLFEDGCDAPLVKQATKDGGVKAISPTTAELWISSANPIQAHSPAIDGAARFAFTSPDRLQVTMETDKFPSYGFDIKKNGREIYNSVDFDASCKSSAADIAAGLTAGLRNEPHRRLYVIDTAIPNQSAFYACEQNSPSPAPTNPQLAFEPFGFSRQRFEWSYDGSGLRIDPPEVNPYEALWGVIDAENRCRVDISFDEVVAEKTDLGNYGFAVAPRASVVNDQPQGASIQYEHEARPDFEAAGSFVRPAELPAGAWSVEVRPAVAPDIRQPHHIEIHATGSHMTMTIDGTLAGAFSGSAEFGAMAIRTWGSAFSFTNLKVTD
ncbi:hypothetical protein ACQPYH_06215 [Kribbella sp. CA-245084]|uniref:hypothetical protein n=1 Tax=Kribbella sp. CA-245084 TaxID=3239940 RepID=UPI003D94223D